MFWWFFNANLTIWNVLILFLMRCSVTSCLRMQFTTAIVWLSQPSSWPYQSEWSIFLLTEISWRWDSSWIERNIMWLRGNWEYIVPAIYVSSTAFTVAGRVLLWIGTHAFMFANVLEFTKAAGTTGYWVCSSKSGELVLVDCGYKTTEHFLRTVLKREPSRLEFCDSWHFASAFL